jgi:UDP-N-acetyl-D-mannosaminuronic acid transferase (WecB/TagA/CpsF family)
MNAEDILMPIGNTSKKLNIWGISINPIRKNDFIEVIDNHITLHPEKPLHITGVNPETISQSLSDLQLKNLIKHGTKICCKIKSQNIRI